MAYDLGSVVGRAIEVRNAAGALTAATVVATVTLPDGTTATPAVSTPSTGTYTVDYLTTQTGRHLLSWAVTGTVTLNRRETFTVVDRSLQLVALADLEQYLDSQTIPTGKRDGAQAALDFAHAVVSSYCRRTFTGVEDNVDLVAGVVTTVAARRYLNPVERSAYTGPGPDGYNYTPAVPAQILTGQEMATLDRFKRVIIPGSVSATAGLP